MKRFLHRLVGNLILYNIYFCVTTFMVTELYYFIPGRDATICDLETDLVGRGSIAKVNLESASNIEK